MQFKLNINEPVNNQIDLLTSISNKSNTHSIEPFKILILDNQRIFNLFKSKKLTLNNFETSYYKYLNYGLVIMMNSDRITIYNDIYGAYPIFKYFHPNGLVHKITNLYEPSSDSQINQIAVAEFVHFNHFLGSNTLHSDIERIPGGTRIELEGRKIKITQIHTWDSILNKIFTIETSKSESFEHLNNAILESSNKHSNVLTLTGGYDSRLLYGILLSGNYVFKNITWGIPGNLQTEIAKDLSCSFLKEHVNIPLDNNFKDNIGKFLEYIFLNTRETPFIIDVAQFIYMCKNLPSDVNLISGFMGSEIIRGPSYSSQVTLTEFAANICLSKNKTEIKNTILDFQRKYPYLNDTFIKDNLDQLVERYAEYSMNGNIYKLRNYNIFRYLFYEKYAKIFGQYIKIHYIKKINLVNPYMDFEFIKETFRSNNSLSEFTPFENGSYKNFMLYKFYAKQLKIVYPELLNTKIDRGYFIKDLLTLHGNLKLIPIQMLRKIKKNRPEKNIKVVDSFLWYKSYFDRIMFSHNDMFNSILNKTLLTSKLKDLDSVDSLDKIKLQLILGLYSSLETIND